MYRRVYRVRTCYVCECVLVCECECVYVHVGPGVGCPERPRRKGLWSHTVRHPTRKSHEVQGQVPPTPVTRVVGDYQGTEDRHQGLLEHLPYRSLPLPPVRSVLVVVVYVGQAHPLEDPKPFKEDPSLGVPTHP